MKAKESAEVGLNLNIKKTKIMTTEEIYNFNRNNKDIKIVKDFTSLSSVINSDGDGSQEIKRRAAIEGLEKITKSKDVSLETKAKIIHTLVFPINAWMQKFDSKES